jgi:uncharacterized membrane protein YbaN (DUF454 family)
VQHRGIPRRVKIYMLLTLWITIGFSVFAAVHVWWLRILLLATAAGITVHILRIRTQKPPPA